MDCVARYVNCTNRRPDCLSRILRVAESRNFIRRNLGVKSGLSPVRVAFACSDEESREIRWLEKVDLALFVCSRRLSRISTPLSRHRELSQIAADRATFNVGTSNSEYHRSQTDFFFRRLHFLRGTLAGAHPTARFELRLGSNVCELVSLLASTVALGGLPHAHVLGTSVSVARPWRRHAKSTWYQARLISECRNIRSSLGVETFSHSSISHHV